jgi:hypothetical protein
MGEELSRESAEKLKTQTAAASVLKRIPRAAGTIR